MLVPFLIVPRGGVEAALVVGVNAAVSPLDLVDPVAGYKIYDKTPDGCKTYDSVADCDRVALIGRVNTLAEDLSTLRGLLGLN